jgi:D-sedoheptulose 7-phosphate isomerase
MLKSNIKDISRLVSDRLRIGRSIFIFGVGGNAATATHFAGELAGKYEQYEDPLSVYCLNDNVSVLTAITNDFGWDVVFSRQIQGLVRSGDVVLAFSISGRAPYLLNAFETAQCKGAVTILLNGGEDVRDLEPFCNYLLTPDSPNEDTPRVQELQLRWVHDLSGLIKGKLAHA